jgi:hypothetical protein
VDRSTIPEQNLQQGIDHQSYAKSAIFTAFWLHSAEMYKARKLIHVVLVMPMLRVQLLSLKISSIKLRKKFLRSGRILNFID